MFVNNFTVYKETCATAKFKSFSGSKYTVNIVRYLPKKQAGPLLRISACQQKTYRERESVTHFELPE